MRREPPRRLADGFFDGLGLPAQFALGLAVVQRRHQLGHAGSDVGERKVAAQQPRGEIIEARTATHDGHRNRDARWATADGARRDVVDFAGAQIAVGDDVAVPVAAAVGGEKHCASGIFDADNLGGKTHVERESAGGHAGDDRAVRVGAQSRGP